MSCVASFFVVKTRVNTCELERLNKVTQGFRWRCVVVTSRVLCVCGGSVRCACGTELILIILLYWGSLSPATALVVCGMPPRCVEVRFGVDVVHRKAYHIRSAEPLSLVSFAVKKIPINCLAAEVVNLDAHCVVSTCLNSHFSLTRWRVYGVNWYAALSISPSTSPRTMARLPALRKVSQTLLMRLLLMPSQFSFIAVRSLFPCHNLSGCCCRNAVTACISALRCEGVGSLLSGSPC